MTGMSLIDVLPLLDPTFSHHSSAYLSTQQCHCVTTCRSSFPPSFMPITHLSFFCVFSSLLIYLLFLFCYDSSSSSIRWRWFVPQTCSKFTGSSCLYGLSKLQEPRETWRQWRSIRARSPSRRSSWWRWAEDRGKGRLGQAWWCCHLGCLTGKQRKIHQEKYLVKFRLFSYFSILLLKQNSWL